MEYFAFGITLLGVVGAVFNIFSGSFEVLECVDQMKADYAVYFTLKNILTLTTFILLVIAGKLLAS